MAIVISKDTIRKPRTYTDIAAPFKDFKEAYDKNEKEYNDTLEKVAILGAYLNKDIDGDAYQKWKTYMDNLDRDVTAFSTKGMDINTIAGLQGLRQSYFRDINPLSVAVDARNKRLDELRQKRANGHNDLFFERDITNASIDNWVNNNNYDWGEVYSGSNAAARVKNLAETFSKQLTNDRFKEMFITQVGGENIGMQLEHIQHFGFTPEQIQDALEHPDKNTGISKILNGILDSVTEEAKSYLSDRDYEAYRAMAAEGLVAANGGDKASMINNPRYSEALQRQQASNTALTELNASGLNINPISLLSTLSTTDPFYQRNFKNGKAINYDKIKLGAKAAGLKKDSKEYEKMVDELAASMFPHEFFLSPTRTDIISAQAEARRLLTQYEEDYSRLRDEGFIPQNEKGQYYIPKDPNTYSNFISSKYKELVNNADAYSHIGYKYNVSDALSKDVLNQIQGNNINGKLYTANLQSDKQGNLSVSNGKRIDSHDLNDYNVVDIKVIKGKMIASLKGKEKDEIINIIVPQGIHQSTYNNVSQIGQFLDNVRTLSRTGKITESTKESLISLADQFENNNIAGGTQISATLKRLAQNESLTESEIEIVKSCQKALQGLLYSEISNFLSTNDVKDQQFTVTGNNN